MKQYLFMHFTNSMNRALQILFMALTIAFEVQGQDQGNDPVPRIYQNAITLLKQNHLVEASAEFDKVLKSSPYHGDALFNLAIVNERLGDSQAAIRFLLRGVALNDKRAVRLLTRHYHYPLSYADTMQNIGLSARQNYLTLQQQHMSTLSALTRSILEKTSDKREQLHLLLLWISDHMGADSVRFFQGGDPLSSAEAFTRRTGLCDEYASLVSEFCTAAAIPGYKVTGYVKYPDFKPGDVLTEANHAWNAVYIDSSWLLCDLFWSTLALETEGPAAPHFIKRLNTKYFLGRPVDFINDHLPVDPVFQFLNHPVDVTAFTKTAEGIDTTTPGIGYLNYADSLQVFSKMGANDQALRIAQHGYKFNADNPNDLIVESYNYAVDVLNKNTASRQQLLKTRQALVKALAIIDESKDPNVRALKSNCKNGIVMLDKRLMRK